VGGHKSKPSINTKQTKKDQKQSQKEIVTFLAEDKSENKSLIVTEFYFVVLRVMIDQFVCTNHNKARDS